MRSMKLHQLDIFFKFQFLLEDDQKAFVDNAKVQIFANKFEDAEAEDATEGTPKKARLDTAALVSVLQQASSIAAPRFKRKAAAAQAEKASSVASSSGRSAAPLGRFADPGHAEASASVLADEEDDPEDDAPLQGGGDASEFFSLSTLGR